MVWEKNSNNKWGCCIVAFASVYYLQQFNTRSQQGLYGAPAVREKRSDGEVALEWSQNATTTAQPKPCGGESDSKSAIFYDPKLLGFVGYASPRDL